MNSFSVLMSVYHKDNPIFLSQALASIWDVQTVKPSEIVIVKDGSLSVELEMVINNFLSLAPVKVIALPTNMGLGYALSVGLQHCTYDLVARMDSDDISLPYRFEKQIAAFQKYPMMSIIGSWIKEFSTDPKDVISCRIVPEFHKEILNYAHFRSPMNHVTVMFRKDDVLRCGNYQSFPSFEDYFLWIRMLIAKCQFYNLQESLVAVRTDLNMIARRGGWEYACNDVRFQFAMYSLKFINLFELVRNIILRFIPRILPNRIRALIYKFVLR